MTIPLKSYWEHWGDRPNGRPPVIAPDRLANPFSQLPPTAELSVEEQTWHDVAIEPGKPTSWFPVMARQRARIKRGPSALQHEQRRRRFSEIKSEAEQLGFRLPTEFVTLMQTDEYVRRLRFGCHSIRLPDFICPCPLDERRIMILFLVESQGCDYTHLLFGSDGSHCVTRTGHWYGLHPRPPQARSTAEEQEIFLLADSFAEYLCRASDEIIEDERACSESYLRLGDRARDGGCADEAIRYYTIALSYAPESAIVKRRLAELRG